jgi:hypothetical protein
MLGVLASYRTSPPKRLSPADHEAFLACPLGPDSKALGRADRGKGDPRAVPGLYLGIVAPAGYDGSSGANCGGRTCLYDPKGTVLVESDSNEEMILHVEVLLGEM